MDVQGNSKIAVLRRNRFNLSRIEVLHVSSAPSPSEFAALLDSVKPLKDDVGYGMPESSFIFQELLREGFAANDEVFVHSLVGRPVHPAVHSGLFRRRKLEKASSNLTIEHVSVLKVRIIKQLWVGFGIFIATLRWRARTSRTRDRVLLVDASYVSALPWVFAGLLGSSVRKLAMFADVYSYMGDVSDARGRATAFQAIVRSLVKCLYGQLDGFVLMTSLMGTVVNPRRQPQLVMEGLVPLISAQDPSETVAKALEPTVMYVGALRKEYGLDDLVAGFMGVPRPDARLVIYGAGPFANEIIEASQLDTRISYGGRIPVNRVMPEQRRAWVLVNTRRADDEFTKYSFPSKMLSYMSSGSAVLTTRLPGMPAEYNEHLYTIDEPGIEGVTTALEAILAIPLKALEARGLAARNFVLHEKNNVAQTRRILDFALEELNACVR